LYIPVVLSIAAGALMVVGGITIILMFEWYHSMYGGLSMMINGVIHQGTELWPLSTTMPRGYMPATLIVLSLLSLGPGIVSVVAGYKIYKKTENVQKWALVVLTASIIGFIGIGLIAIPATIGIIAGIMGIILSARR
jgi:hypothetical protein